MNEFNPFGRKNIRHIEIGDLETLRSVPEGWYVEYKSEVPSRKSITKSISAFANTYGGWLFYGISEKGDGSRKAGDFPGITLQDAYDREIQIRDAINHGISPIPHFEVRVLPGPCAELSIPAGRAIIAIYVPKGFNAPYVHGSGCIYRRLADSSDPRPESDRYFLDLLWSRRKEIKLQFDQAISKSPTFYNSEDNLTVIEFVLFADPYLERNIESNISFNEFAELIASKDYEFGGIPFTSVMTTKNGFIARQTENNFPDRTLFSWRYYSDCASTITIPLSSRLCSNSADVSKFLFGYQYSEIFRSQWNKSGIRAAHIIDSSLLFNIILSIFKKKRAILRREGLPWKIFYKIKVHNCWGRIAYIDLAEANTFIEQYGIPIIQDNEIIVPEGSGPDRCIKSYENTENSQASDDSIYTDTLVAHSILLNAFGYPHSVLGLTTESISQDIIVRLINLRELALKVNSRRSQFD